MQQLDYQMWFYKQPNDTLRIKRRSAKLEAHFPKEYRVIYQKEGAARLVAILGVEHHISLIESWNLVQWFFNSELEKPFKRK